MIEDGERFYRQNEHEHDPSEIKKFSDEARASLIGQGFAIDVLTGQSIFSFRESGAIFFWANWHKNEPDLENIPSMKSEVAIKPTALFLPGSNNRSLPEQVEMTSKFSKELSGQIPGVEAVMGGMADYVDLFSTRILNHDFDIGLDNNYDFARSNTVTSDNKSVEVGLFHPMFGIRVFRDDPLEVSAYKFAAPLVIPK